MRRIPSVFPHEMIYFPILKSRGLEVVYRLFRVVRWHEGKLETSGFE